MRTVPPGGRDLRHIDEFLGHSSVKSLLCFKRFYTDRSLVVRSWNRMV